MAVWQHNRAEIIANEQRNRTTPSCVAFTDAGRLIGDAAKNQLARNPTNTIFGESFSQGGTIENLYSENFSLILGLSSPKCCVPRIVCVSQFLFPPVFMCLGLPFSSVEIYGC